VGVARANFYKAALDSTALESMADDAKETAVWTARPVERPAVCLVDPFVTLGADEAVLTKREAHYKSSAM